MSEKYLQQVYFRTGEQIKFQFQDHQVRYSAMFFGHYFAMYLAVPSYVPYTVQTAIHNSAHSLKLAF